LRSERDNQHEDDEVAPGGPSEAAVLPHLLSDNALVGPDGRLAIGGVDVGELASEYGTPLFVYDEEHLRARCREAVASFGEGVAFATKAFLCKAMARLAVEEGMLLDVSTGGELAVALAAGVDPGRLVLHGNNKSDEELAAALACPIGRIIVDSFDEIARLDRLSPGDRAPMHVSIRVTPGIEAHTHVFVRTGQEDSKFGFSLSSGAARQALSALRQIRGLVVDGIHVHIGSQIFRLDAFEQAIALVAPLLREEGLSELSVGGGLGVAYLNDEAPVTIAQWAEVIHEACRRGGIPDSVAVGAEPGRSIVATAALTCYRIGTIKELPDIRTYVAVDGGMSDNPRPVLYGSGYEAFLPERANEARPRAVRVVGKHCESGDVIVSDARLPATIAVGELLATPVTGAYGFSMASNYNRLGRPPVVFVAGGAARLVSRRETAEDLLRLEP
jgi:diaminopimelate decarboxylase